MKSNHAFSFVSAGFILILLAGSLCAQAPEGSSASSTANLSAEEAVRSISQADSGSKGQPLGSSTGNGRDPSFIIGNTDVLAINVWKEPEVSRVLPVRSDGMISLPLAGEVRAAGRTPLQLEREIADKLRVYMTDPEVTVIVQEINSQRFNILGQVARPGTYPLAHLTSVLDAIALAGGFRDFAKQKGVYILRQDAGGHESRIPFNYKAVIKGRNPEQNIRLEPRDTIVVP